MLTERVPRASAIVTVSDYDKHVLSAVNLSQSLHSQRAVGRCLPKVMIGRGALDRLMRGTPRERHLVDSSTRIIAVATMCVCSIVASCGTAMLSVSECRRSCSNGSRSMCISFLICTKSPSSPSIL